MSYNLTFLVVITISSCACFPHFGAQTISSYFRMTINRQGARNGEVVRALASHECGPGSNPGVDAI